MTYRLLDNGTGIIISRQPKLIKDVLCIKFTGGPSGATAILEIGSDSYYREITDDGLCGVSTSNLAETVKVTVAVLNGDTTMQRWACEELKVTKLENIGYLVAPNDMNLPQIVTRLLLENQDLFSFQYHSNIFYQSYIFLLVEQKPRFR